MLGALLPHELQDWLRQQRVDTTALVLAAAKKLSFFELWHVVLVWTEESQTTQSARAPVRNSSSSAWSRTRLRPRDVTVFALATVPS